jgi:O-antigen/teichoic acid export membrane protein
LLSLLASETDVGFYSAPARIFGTLLFIPTTIAIVTFPRFAAAHREDPDNLPQMADQVLRITVVAGIAVTLGSIALSDDVLIGLLGSEFAKAGPVIVVMAISLVPTGVGAVLARMAFATNRQAAVAVLGAVAIPFRLALVVMLIVLFEARYENPALGAVAGFVIAETGLALAMLRFSPRGTFSAASRNFYVRVGAALGASIVVLLITWAPLGSLMAGLLASAMYCAGVLMLRAYTVTEILGFATAMLGRRFSRLPASA